MQWNSGAVCFQFNRFVGFGSAYKYWLLWFCLLAISGCQQLNNPNQAELPLAGNDSGQPSWWRASFQLSWDKEIPPQWHYGPFIAEQVILPVLQRHRGDIQLWRFHRRAGLDATGHRFSFLYYADQRSAAYISELIKINGPLEELIKKGAVLAVDIKPYTAKGGEKVAATSDPHWTPIMQQTWPHFLMGVSRMWLEQVILFSKQIDLAENLENKENAWNEGQDFSEHYIKVQAALSQLWREEGNHAYLHHLNAMYAYQSLLQRY